jgi:hypothetical protein
VIRERQETARSHHSFASAEIGFNARSRRPIDAPTERRDSDLILILGPSGLFAAKGWGATAESKSRRAASVRSPASTRQRR